MEVFLALVGLGLTAWFIVLPMVLWLRTRQLPGLRARIEELEREIGRLRMGEAAPPQASATDTAGTPAVSAERQPVASPPPVHRADLEDWIGRKGLGWTAVVVLLFAAAFFLNAAFENAWVGERGRVGLGLLAGAALCLAGFRYHRRGWRRFSQMLTSGGVVLLYLATFAAFGYYHLLAQEQAAVCLAAVIVGAAVLALLYDAPAIGLMAVVGGLLNPVLLDGRADQHQALFTYLALLDAGAVAVVLLRRWLAVALHTIAPRNSRRPWPSSSSSLPCSWACSWPGPCCVGPGPASRSWCARCSLPGCWLWPATSF
jgi:uncharacterized membrane protein